MKKVVLIISAVLINLVPAFAQTAIKYINADTLNLIGKIAPTPQPYHRLDIQKYQDFTAAQNILVQEPAGLALCFRTNSSRIIVRTYYRRQSENMNMTGITMYGYDLYIKRAGKWLYAASNATKTDGKDLNLISHMNTTDKECLMYLPAFSIVDSILIGIDENASIQSMPNPFRHRLVIFGSSFTHGTSSNRPGMSYPMQIERSTGLYIISLGVSGNSKLQQSFARVLADAKADAFIFDAFSNPTATEIEKNFVSFVQTIRKAHPTTPLIFMQTIYREQRNFDEQCNNKEQLKMDMAAKVVREVMKHDKNIYFINSGNMTGNDHITSTDGIHPSALGYYRWATKLQPILLNILRRYNIR